MPRFDFPHSLVRATWIVGRIVPTMFADIVTQTDNFSPAGGMCITDCPHTYYSVVEWFVCSVHFKDINSILQPLTQIFPAELTKRRVIIEIGIKKHKVNNTNNNKKSMDVVKINNEEKVGKMKKKCVSSISKLCNCHHKLCHSKHQKNI